MGMDVIAPGNVALVTGGATGLGNAALHRFANAGMSLVVADVKTDLFDAVESSLMAAGAKSVMTANTDVGDKDNLDALKAKVDAELGGVDLLMCNAGVQVPSDVFDSQNSWESVLRVNLFGVTNCCQTFVPAMMERGRSGMVINTGSKQGITTPPGNPVYNMSKAGVKVYTEALAFHLREAKAPISVHLFVPGFVFTPLTRPGGGDKPDAAWTPDETVDYLMERLAADDFYIICPDNDVTTEIDQKRMAWAMGDIIENRPPLSRWHADWADAFTRYIEKD